MFYYSRLNSFEVGTPLIWAQEEKLKDLEDVRIIELTEEEYFENIVDQTAIISNN